MAKVDWIILCERAIIEETINTISLVCIVERVALAPPLAIPTEGGAAVAVPFRFYAVSQWSRSKPDSPELATGRVVLKSPKGRQLGHMEFAVDLKTAPRARVISMLPGFPFTGFGAYVMQVQIKSTANSWRTMREAEFVVADGPVAAAQDAIGRKNRRLSQ